MKKYILLISIFITSLSCNDLIIKKHIVENYYLTAPDIAEQSSLTYKNNNKGNNYFTVVDATVYSVGYDSSYIFLKQYPHYPNKTITNYYIVERQKDVICYQEKIYGPFTLEEFNKKCSELRVKEVHFTINLDL